MCHDGIIMVVTLIMCATVFWMKTLLCKSINSFGDLYDFSYIYWPCFSVFPSVSAGSRGSYRQVFLLFPVCIICGSHTLPMSSAVHPNKKDHLSSQEATENNQ